MKIAVHTLVKNEGRFLWFAVASVAPYVDRVLLWDDGSTDNTIKIIAELKEKFGKKIDARLIDKNTEFKNLRGQMLKETNEDWFLVVDGDEIWWDQSIKAMVREIKKNGKNLESIVVPTINLVGDIYHYQEEAAGRYELAGRKGHLNLRAVNKNIPGLSSDKPHGTWGWTDLAGKMIQYRKNKKIKFLESPYLHASFLQRSDFWQGDKSVPKRAKKLKHEIGISFPLDFYYPEVFFKERPKFIISPWQRIDSGFRNRAMIETPLRKIKRRIIVSGEGY